MLIFILRTMWPLLSPLWPFAWRSWGFAAEPVRVIGEGTLGTLICLTTFLYRTRTGIQNAVVSLIYR